MAQCKHFMGELMSARQLTETSRAMELVDKGMTKRAAANLCGITETTLYRAIKRAKDVRQIPTEKVVETLQDNT